MKSSDRPKFGNLQNLKVLNAGAVIAAPFVCELFAEQGADVIELESTVAPDMYRMYGDAWSVDRRNQRMITLNIKSSLSSNSSYAFAIVFPPLSLYAFFFRMLYYIIQLLE